MMRRRPTAAGLAAALGLKPEAPVPEAVAEPVAPAEPVPVAAAPVTRRPGRMGGVVVPAAVPAEPRAPREQPTTPRPVLLRRDDGERHPIPDEWLDERGVPFPGWWLSDEEMRALVDATPPGRTCRETWPGCMSQICPVTDSGMDTTPFSDWCHGHRKPVADTRYRKRPRG